MDSPPYLLDQYAKARGITAANAKRAIMLHAYADEGRPLADAIKALRISKYTARVLARRFLIDFPDYRPYAALESKGEPRPAPKVRADQPAQTLPLFAA